MTARRWDLALVAGTALAVWAAGHTTGAFFLHFDAPTQDVAALEWVRGCWGYSTSKVLPILLLGPFFAAFGPAPGWETGLLALGFAVSAVTAYELARLFTGARLAGALSALALLALPAFQYFSRTHLGYPMPFLLLGWLALRRARWPWAGLCFGLAIAAHYNSWVPVGLSLAALALVSGPLKQRFPGEAPSLRGWIGLAALLALPLLAVDGLFFLYSGQWFEWNRGVFGEILRLAQLGAGAPHPDWPWVWRMSAGSNGWALSALLALGLSAPFALRRDRIGLACALAFTGLAALYTLQAGLGRAFLVSRVLAPAYPFWAVGAGIVLAFIARRLRPPALQSAASVLVAAGLAWPAIASARYIRQFTATPYAQIGAWVTAAGELGRPVRYTGNMWVGLFYAQVAGVELLANDERWIQAGAPGQAVLIFEGEAPAGLPEAGYTRETALVSPAADGWHPVLTDEAALPRQVEVWQPSEASEPLEPSGSLPEYAVHYLGAGCITPPAYGDGTLHFYQLAWNRLTGGARP